MENDEEKKGKEQEAHKLTDLNGEGEKGWAEWREGGSGSLGSSKWNYSYKKQ